MLLPLLAAALSTICVGAAARQVQSITRVELPSAAELLARIDALLPPGAAAEQRRAELDEAISDVDRSTRGVSELPRALARIALAGGTALALGALASHPDLEHLPSAGAAFGAGVVGAVCVAHLGRLASARSRKAREHWSELGRRLRRQLEQS